MTGRATDVDWAAEVDRVLEPTFGGVVSVGPLDAEVDFERAYGYADRAHGVPARVDTRFATASATKTLTAVVVAGLAEAGQLRLDTTARSLLGRDLPLVADDVTVEHLLTHTSGIGDYVDEETGEVDTTVPVYDLVDTADYLPALDGHPTVFPAGERFRYCNSGYVLLALLCERATGTSFHDLVAERVLAPAGMTATAFLRADALPGDASLHYLEDGRTNVFAIPVRGNGDGGIYATVADVRRFWSSLLDGRLVGPESLRRMTSPQAGGPPRRYHYGWGLWLSERALVMEGCDHGVSFRSVCEPSSRRVWTVAANTSEGAWPVARRLHELLF